MTDIYFARLRPNAIVPTKRGEDAGYDIYPCFDAPYMIIAHSETKLIPTGLASAFSDEYYLQLQERGSLGALGIGVRAGVIDSGFRGEWMMGLTNHGLKPFVIIEQGMEQLLEHETGLTADTAKLYPKNKAIYQVVLLPVPKAMIHEISVDELLQIKSARGAGMLGSSNK